MALQIQERDLRLLGDIALVGLISFETIWTRHFATGKKGQPSDQQQKACGRRLRVLVDAGLLRKLDDQPGYPDRLYTLPDKGAELLHALCGIEEFRIVKDPPKLSMLLHRLEVGCMVLTFNDACVRQKLPKPPWILE